MGPCKRLLVQEAPAQRREDAQALGALCFVHVGPLAERVSPPKADADAGRTKKQKAHSREWAFKTPAASYSPTGLPLQYHRP